MEERIFIKYVEEQHPLLQELPESFRKIWFHCFQSQDTKDYLFLQMERIYQNPQLQEGAFVDLLTFEIVDTDALLEWEEDFSNQKFVASDPYYIFYEGMDGDKGMFSVGELDRQTMKFTPELEIFISIQEKGLLIDFEEGKAPEWWLFLEEKAETKKGK